MQALTAIRTTLKFSDMGTAYLATMSDAPLLRPTDPTGKPTGNHALWIAGHLAVVEARLHQMIHGTPNPLAHWKPLFDWGSEPSDNPAHYPPFDQVLQAFKDQRAKTHAYLDTHGEPGLDHPTKSQPPGFTGFEKVGPAILIIAAHAAGHLGTLNVLRNLAHKPRLFTPSKELRDY